MHSKIPILSLTSIEYSEKIFQLLGKGQHHATLIYEEWFRTGQVTGNNPAFNNAKVLLEQIIAATNFFIDECNDKREDGNTGKILLKTFDQLEVEAVLIPMQAGGTLCVSSQVGCKMGCSFCETGRMGLIRNLSTSEILSQLFIAKFKYQFDIRNIVFMGMGEPFDNYDEVMQAFRVMTDPHGFGFGHNHITISTSGRVDGIEKLMQEKGPIPHLALSINAPNDLIRNKLMPINRTFDMNALHNAMASFCQATGKEILVAYVLIKGINDSLQHAEQLAKYLQGLSIRINLIPYNRQSHDRYETAEMETIHIFTNYLRKMGYNTLLRQTKGDKIMAACGQLGNLELKKQRKNCDPSV